MKIKLSKKQFDYLNYSLIEDNKNLFDKLQKNILGNSVYLELDENTANDIRDWAGRKQQELGFDEEYDLTPEGKMLEELIDAFFTG